MMVVVDHGGGGSLSLFATDISHGHSGVMLRSSLTMC